MTEKCDCGGCSCGALPIKNARSLNKKVSHHPMQCQLCEDEYHIQEDGPDAGMAFACGIMIENMEAGCSLFECPWFKRKEYHRVSLIDADTANAALKLMEAARRIGDNTFIDADSTNEAIALVRVLKQPPKPKPITVTEERIVPIPSPHEWLDKAIRVASKKRIIKELEAQSLKTGIAILQARLKALGEAS